ncbi:MAG TPA: hypothetical protein VEV41_24430 [Terriglobales bacterium]|jgi:hypothetical protein|nr:hypothetical protein [Terriglobales bacterium]
MGDEELRHEQIEFEREDLSPWGILAFLIGLAITGLLMHLIGLGMYIYLDHYEKRHEPPQNPLVRATGEDTRVATSQEANKFPSPRLETNERGQLYEQRTEEEETLNSYGWVDQNAGVAHIPIDRAMAIIAQRGLPVAPPTAPETAAQKPQSRSTPKVAKLPGQAPAKQQ